MQALLINQNATIERLVKLSSGKQGYGLALANDISEVANGSYDFVIIDSDLYNKEEFGILRQKFNVAKTILIVSKGAARPSGFDVYIEKPFLPTELLDAFCLLEQNIAANPVLEQTISAEEAIFEGNIASFADFDDHTEDELKTLDEHDIFGSSIGDIKDDFTTLDEYDLGDEISFDDSEGMEFEKTADIKEDIDEEDELEFSFDDEEENKETNNESLFAIDDEELIDDFQLDTNNDAHDELSDFDFSLDDDSLLEDKVGTPIASEEIDSFDDLQGHTETLDKEEEEFDMSEFENDENVDMMFEEINLEETKGYEDDFDENEDPFADVGSAHMFEQDEVNKLKNLLDETEDGEMDNDDFDLENVKIFNDELGSLTEESLAEALGVNVKDEQSGGANAANQHHIENAMSNAPLQPLPDAPKAAVSEQQVSSEPTNNAIQLTPNQSVTLSLEALKELLSIADITINITLTKKQ